jgi:hypothetical protein
LPIPQIATHTGLFSVNGNRSSIEPKSYRRGRNSPVCGFTPARMRRCFMVIAKWRDAAGALKAY